MLRQAIDISNWQGELDTDTAARLLAARVGVSVQAVYGDNGTYTRQQLGVLRSAGYTAPLLDAYIWWHPHESNTINTHERLDLLDRYGIKQVWVDVEDTKALDLGIEQRISRLATTLATVRVRGYEPGIYSAAWYWPNYMANTPVFKDYPLWSVGSKNGSGYGDPPDTLLLWAPYGGWTKAEGIQYTSNGYIEGYGPVDASVWEDGELTQDEFNAMLKTAIGMPGGYQETVEKYMDELNGRLVDIENTLLRIKNALIL